MNRGSLWPQNQVAAVLGPQEPRVQDHEESQVYRARSHLQAYSQRETLILKDKCHLRSPGKRQGPVSSLGASPDPWLRAALLEGPQPLLFLRLCPPRLRVPGCWLLGVRNALLSDSTPIAVFPDVECATQSCLFQSPPQRGSMWAAGSPWGQALCWGQSYHATMVCAP